jgi:hypothetical protein
MLEVEIRNFRNKLPQNSYVWGIFDYHKMITIIPSQKPNSANKIIERKIDVDESNMIIVYRKEPLASKSQRDRITRTLFEGIN